MLGATLGSWAKSSIFSAYPKKGASQPRCIAVDYSPKSKASRRRRILMSTSNSIRRAVHYALLTSATAAVSMPVFAADQTIQEVVVTGSRIAQPNLETTSPVTQVTCGRRHHPGRHQDRRPGEPVAAGLRGSERDGRERLDGHRDGEPARPRLGPHPGAGRWSSSCRMAA